MKPMSALAALLLLLTGFGGPAARTSERERAMHALNRLAFGPRPGDVERVLATGVDRWVEQQIHPESLPDQAVAARLARYETLDKDNAELLREYYQPLVRARREAKKGADDGVQNDAGKSPKTNEAMKNSDAADPESQREVRQMRQKSRRVVMELTAQRILRAAESERQLNEVMVDFWMNHFNVYAGKGIDRFLLTSYERDVIRPHIWGRFEDLLMATAKSPAMLFYLDNARSVAAPENRPEGSQRVLERRNPQMAQQGGLNENYAREIMELHTLGVDGGYSQKDVTELARVLTGWSISRPAEGRGEFVFRRALHDAKEKTVLGTRLKSGGGIEEGEAVIRMLAAHPSTARHIAYKLCQRLVADEPPKALVDRVAKRFLDSRGDLRATVKAIVTSPEFWDPRYYRTKVKSPFEYVISAARAAGAQVENPIPLARELQKIGQPLYFSQPPTGYADTSEAWMNSGALMNRLNFALSLAANGVPGVRVDANRWGAAAAAEQQTSATAEDVQRLAAMLTGGPLSEETQRAITARRGEGAPVIAGLILGSPEFQKQ